MLVRLDEPEIKGAIADYLTKHYGIKLDFTQIELKGETGGTLIDLHTVCSEVVAEYEI